MQKPTFLIADPSMSTLGGHYLEYLNRVLGAAEKSGMTCIVACNAALDPSAAETVSWPVFPVFEFDVWGLKPAAFLPPNEALIPSSRLRFRLQASRAGVLWAMSGDPATANHYAQSGGLSEARMRHLKQALRLRKAVGRALEKRSVELGVMSRSERADAEIMEIRRALASKAHLREDDGQTYSRDGRLDAAERASIAAASFCRSLEQLIDRARLGADDIVFLPTMAWHDVRGLIGLIQRRGGRSLPRFGLVFRRDLFREYPDQYLSQDYAVHERRMLLADLENLGCDRITLFTDTRELSFQYAQFFSDVHTLPVPCEELAPAKPKAAGKPIVFGYLGDAREEKGFRMIPGLLEHFKPVKSKSPKQPPVKFLCQTYAPKGSSDLAILRAIESLRQAPAELVEIVPGAQGSAAYRKLIERTDGILVPYDRGNYAARSSGVFMEGVCARRPVVVTAGTWMSRTLDELTYGFHNRVVQPDHVIGTLTGALANWNEMRDTGETPLTPAAGGALDVSSGCKGVSSTVKCPKSASHIWLTFRIDPKSVGQFCRVVFACRDAGLQELRYRTHVVGGLHGNQLSIISPLPPATHDVWIMIGNAYSTSAFTLHDLNIRMIRTEDKLPRGAGGLSFDPAWEGRPGAALAQTLEECVETWPLLEESARYVGDLLGPLNNSDALFSDIARGFAL